MTGEPSSCRRAARRLEDLGLALDAATTTLVARPDLVGLAATARSLTTDARDLAGGLRQLAAGIERGTPEAAQLAWTDRLGRHIAAEVAPCPR